MNIIVRTGSGKCIVRPDTTWERDSEDFYPPEFVEDISYSPVLFARICKPGRSIGKKFASRYYDISGYGILLYPENLIDGNEEGFAVASCLDHTTFITLPSGETNSDPSADGKIGSKEKFSVFSSLDDGEEHELDSFHGLDCNLIEEAICEATKYVYIRIGDLIAVELSPRKPLCKRDDRRCHVYTRQENLSGLDFKIIF